MRDTGYHPPTRAWTPYWLDESSRRFNSNNIRSTTVVPLRTHERRPPRAKSAASLHRSSRLVTGRVADSNGAALLTRMAGRHQSAMLQAPPIASSGSSHQLSSCRRSSRSCASDSPAAPAANAEAAGGAPSAAATVAAVLAADAGDPSPPVQTVTAQQTLQALQDPCFRAIFDLDEWPAATSQRRQRASSSQRRTPSSTLAAPKVAPSPPHPESLRYCLGWRCLNHEERSQILSLTQA